MYMYFSSKVQSSNYDREFLGNVSLICNNNNGLNDKSCK